MLDLPVNIIRSKLYPPPIPLDIIQRQRLLSLIGNAARSPVTIVSAPAGYGKSTLVSQWLESMQCKSTWLSLDPGDGDLTQFVCYVVAALRSCCSGCCADTAETLRSAVLPGPGAIAGVFCNDLEQFEGPVTLVLDDYHHISSSEVDEFLDTVLKHPPGNLHLIIVTRRDPALSLHALRARGALNEVRMQQLAFREDESRAFVRGSLSDAIADDDIAKLHERTEGWPAALRLAVLAARETGTPASMIGNLPADSYAVRIYLMQEVLTKQSADIRQYLLRTAFLDRFCAGLCDAVISEDTVKLSGKDFVNQVLQASLFLIPLDVDKQWLRFHHLFQTLLQEQALTELGDDVVRDVHMRASRWLEEHELLADAILHALKADKPGEAADVISRHRIYIMNREWWHQLDIWLRLLPSRIVASRPELQLLKARIFRTAGQNEALVESLDHAESLLDSADIDHGLRNELRGSVASLRCFQLYMESNGEGAALAARKALQLLPPDDLAERGFAMVLLGAALQMTGDAKAAKSVVYAAMADESARRDASATYKTRLLASLMFVHWLEADLAELERVARDAVDACTRADLWEVLTGAAQFKAAVHYHQNRLTEIEDDLGIVLRKKGIASPEFHAYSLIIMTLTQDALGNSADALNTSASLHDLAFRTHNPYLISLSGALSAELAMRQGRVAEALTWANQYEPEPFIPTYAFFSQPMCLAKILVHDDSAQSRERAQALLPRLEAYLARIHNKRFIIEVLALRAILSDKTGDKAVSIKQLDRAVSLAQPSGFIRLFVDIGPGLIPLLNRLELRGEKLQYVGRILAAFPRYIGHADTARASTISETAIDNIAELSETLSRREKEVLSLLVERLTNKEIGEQLFISTATVKRHAQSIYEKLNVNSRREAVTKAVGLGLMSDKSLRTGASR